MELTTAIKERYMLGQSTGSLHEECHNWLNTIAFWQDEVAFYERFVKETLFHTIKQEDKERIDKLFEEVIEYDLDDLKDTVRDHLTELDRSIGYKNGLRTSKLKHWDISQKMENFGDRMKFAKHGIFELFKLVNEDHRKGNDALRIINERRAVRKYKKDSIDKMHVEEIISAGRMAPSALNRQPWKFYVITDPEKIKRYSQKIVAVSSRLLHFFLRKFNHEEDSVFHDAPVVIFITAKKNNEWGALDVGMCAQNMMLAAKSMGYDTCPVGLANAIEETESYSELNIPASEEIKLAIVLGYGNEQPKLPERRNDNIVYLA